MSKISLEYEALLVSFFFYFLVLLKIFILKKFQKIRDNHKLLMILGPSGSGKDTLMNLLKDKHPDKFIKCISYTTRSPRKDEKQGQNYYYISKENFKKLDSEHKIIGKFEKYGNFYGTSIDLINENIKKYKDKIIYFDYNIETAIKTLEIQSLKFNYIAIVPPNIKELEKRLIGRKSETKDSLLQRINYAKKELEMIDKANFLNYTIKNINKDEAFLQFESCLSKLYPEILK